MSTRSTSSNLFSPLRDPESLIRRRNLGEPSSLFDFEEVMSIPHNNMGPPPAGPHPPNNGPPPVVRPNGQAPRSMEELCQPSIDGRGGPIAPIPIQATDFGLRHHMIQQVQNTCQFHGLPGDDANRHIDKFLEITQHMKQNGVFDDALCLSLFPYSLTHHAIAWYDRLPRNSIHSFDDMMRKFLSKYFRPSMVTKLKNEITKFEQKPHESLFEAWERYKLSIDRYPNHNMLLVTQIDSFYNGLTFTTTIGTLQQLETRSLEISLLLLLPGSVLHFVRPFNTPHPRLLLAVDSRSELPLPFMLIFIALEALLITPSTNRSCCLHLGGSQCVWFLPLPDELDTHGIPEMSPYFEIPYHIPFMIHSRLLFLGQLSLQYGADTILLVFKLYGSYASCFNALTLVSGFFFKKLCLVPEGGIPQRNLARDARVWVILD
ncbi:reverse transcriptase domain-containing protein [Tanacetum coccineum]